MLTSLICGANSHLEEDDDITSSCLIPRRSRKHTIKRNPYSSLGLEKFSKLLSELEAKKKQIYLQNNPQDISMVRFVCKGSDPEPVVIKVRQDQQNIVSKQQSFNHRKREDTSNQKLRKIHWNTNVLSVIIFILVCLAVFGRSGATLIMAVAWYLIPVASKRNVKKDKQVGIEIGKKMTGSTSNKDYVRKISENYKIGKSQNLEKKGHAHRKSW